MVCAVRGRLSVENRRQIPNISQER